MLFTRGIVPCSPWLMAVAWHWVGRRHREAGVQDLAVYDWWASGQPDKLLDISLPSLVLPAATATLSATGHARGTG